MPWDWSIILPLIPQKKQRHYEMLHHQASLLEPIPKTKETAIPITEENIESIFLKVFEEHRDFDFSYLEKRLKLFKKKFNHFIHPPYIQTEQHRYFVYFPTTILRVFMDDEKKSQIIEMRVWYDFNNTIYRYAHWEN